MSDTICQNPAVMGDSAALDESKAESPRVSSDSQLILHESSMGDNDHRASEAMVSN